MNKKLLIALALCAAPAMAAPALTLKPAQQDRSLTVAAEYTRYDAALDTTSIGGTVKFDKVLAPMNHGNYWSWNAAFSYGAGTVDNGKGANDTDFTTMDFRLGIDANIVTSKKLTVFVGPRVGYSIMDIDLPNTDKTKSIMFGFSVGARYLTNGGTGIEVGYTKGYFNNTEDNFGMNDDTHSFYAGVSFGF